MAIVSELTTLADVADLVAMSSEPVYVRFSAGPERDRDSSSVDHESGLRLPGLAVNPLRPPAWWTDRSLEEWVARQITTYAHLRERDDDRRCWLLSGTVVDHGPDNEPLLDDVRWLASVADGVLGECGRRRSDLPNDDREPGGSAPWQASA